MRQVVTATDRIDYWIRRRIVPCDALLPGNANPASDRYVGLTTTIGQHLRDQYELAAPVLPHLAALVEKTQKRRNRRNLWVLYGTGTRRQFIPEAARLSSQAAFVRHRIIQPAFSMAVAPFFGIPSFCVERNQS
jgi:hypothetical protein